MASHTQATSGPPHPWGGGNAIPFRALYEFLPVGVVVCSAAGELQRTNLAARRLLRGPAERARSCCELFGCGREGTALAGHCISALSAAATGPLAEVSIELAEGGGRIWLTGAPLGGSEGWVALTARPAVGGQADAASVPRLRVFTLGRTRLEGADGAALPASWLGTRPGRIFKYLILARDRVVPGEELAEIFWPNAAGSRLTSVRQAIHTLRDRLEPNRPRHAASSFVLTGSGGYELALPKIWLDVDDFESCVAEGARAMAQDPDSALAAYDRAVELYRGDFLGEEIYAEWTFGARDRLRDLAGQALRGLARAQTERGEFGAATQQLHRLVELEPLELDTQRALLALLLRRGRHSEAARRHDALAHRWRVTFGENLPFTLADLRGD